MYARTYPPRRDDGQTLRELQTLPTADEILIPQNYHGELIRPSGKDTAKTTDEEFFADARGNFPDAVPALQERPPMEAPPQKEERTGLLTGLFGDHAGDDGTLLLIGIALLLFGDKRDSDGRMSLEEDDLILLVILLLLLL